MSKVRKAEIPAAGLGTRFLPATKAITSGSEDIIVITGKGKRPKGLGDAVYQAKTFVGNEPFVVMLGDDIMVDGVPLTKQLMNNYDKTKASTLAVIQVPHEETSKYGVIDPVTEVSEGIYTVDSFVEKPNPEDVS